MSELERKETTIRKEGLTIRIRRTEKGAYTWVIEADSKKLDPDFLEGVVEYADKLLRKKLLSEDVELPEPPKVPQTEERKEERIERTIPLESRNKRLFGRVIIYEDKIALEPLKPLPVKDGAITWLVRYLQEQYGEEKVGFEHDRTDRYFRRVIISEKIDDEQLEDLKEKAAWSFIRAIVRPAKRRSYERKPYRKRVWRRWKRGR